MHEKVKKFINTKLFHDFIMGIIILNGITMGFETSKSIYNAYEFYFELFNTIVITIFTIEISLRIYVYKLKFFKDPWSIFDFFIVTISLIPSSGSFEVLRVLRVLRLLRLISIIPQMQKIVMALVGVLPGMGAIAGLLAIIFYIFAIMATNLYAETFPEWFGSLGASIFTLFQIMTLESWSMGIVRPIMEVHPNAWLFFVPYIMVATFIMINLIIAVVVEAMQDLTKSDKKHVIDEVHHMEELNADDIHRLSKEIQELKQLIIESNKNK